MKNPLIQLTSVQARRIWLHAQRLDTTEPFGSGPKATPAAVAHLGYLQIDTIYVIERSHHHILYTRIPAYRREHLHQAQSIDKTVFEYWTHALSYVPTENLRFFVRQMRGDWQRRIAWLGKVSNGDLRRVLSRIRRHGALTIRDIDDEPVEKDYAWASRKPSKRVLEVAFYKGLVTISQRAGMLKTYELHDSPFRLGPSAARSDRKGNSELPAGSCPAIAGDRECGIDLSSGRSTQTSDEASAGVASPSKGADPGATGRSGPVAALGPSGDPRCHSRSRRRNRFISCPPSTR